jgi:hypothetical protein
MKPSRSAATAATAAPQGPDTASGGPPAVQTLRHQTRKEPVSDLQAIADRVEIEALRGEFTDAVMMHDYDRLASLFTHDGALRIPHINAGATGREQIRAGIERLQGLLDYFGQPHTRARSSWTATPRPAVPTSQSSGAAATAGRS